MMITKQANEIHKEFRRISNLITNIVLLNDEYLQKVFHNFDSNHDGIVEFEEIERIVTVLNNMFLRNYNF